MPLVTLQTRLRQVLNAAQQLRTFALVSPIKLQTGTETYAYLFFLRRKFTNWLSGVVASYENDNDLANYADIQFVTTFNLLTRIAGMKALLQSAVAEIDALTAPYTQQTAPNPLPLVDPSRITNLVAIFNSMVENIPE